MKKYSQQQINSKFRKKQCLECEKGKLNYTGKSPQGGWVAYYTCDCCGTKYEYQDSDMGQTLEDLRSDATETNRMTKFKGTKGKWKVRHSDSKTAFNVVGTVLGGNYKIARCPYLAEESMSKEWNEKGKAECEANAKLISAAPDLLEALELVLVHATVLINENHPDYKKAISAIKKATE